MDVSGAKERIDAALQRLTWTEQSNSSTFHLRLPTRGLRNRARLRDEPWPNYWPPGDSHWLKVYRTQPSPVKPFKNVTVAGVVETLEM